VTVKNKYISTHCPGKDGVPNFGSQGRNDMQTKQFQKKICLLGDGAVGKTSLIRKYVLDVFDDKYISTVGTKLSRKEIVFDVPEKEMKVAMTLMIWDIVGQKEYQKLHLMYFQGANGAIVVSDVTRKETLDNCVTWAESIRGAVGDLPLIFLANKSDLKEQAEFGEAELAEVAAKYGSKYYMTSAKSGLNVEETFLRLSQGMVG